MANQKKKWNQLKADGWYGTDISAYNEQDAHGKQQFLRDAKALLREVAAHLARHGLMETDGKRDKRKSRRDGRLRRCIRTLLESTISR